MSVEAAAHDRAKYRLTIKRNERSPSREIAAHNQRNVHFAPEDKGMAVCLLPGTELSFADDIRRWSRWPSPWNETVISYRTAIFRQINKDKRATHHDALEFPNGEIVLLTTLVEGQ